MPYCWWLYLPSGQSDASTSPTLTIHNAKLAAKCTLRAMTRAIDSDTFRNKGARDALNEVSLKLNM